MPTGPSFSIANNAEMFLKMGDLAKAAKTAEQGITQAEKAALRLEKKTGAIDPKLQAYVQRLEKVVDASKSGQIAQDWNSAIAENAVRGRMEKFEQLHEAHITERIGMKFQRVMGGAFTQKLMRGEPIEAIDMIREVRGTEKLVEKGLKAAGIASPSLGMLGLGLTVGVEAVEAIDKAVEKVKREREIQGKIGKQYGRGLLSDTEFEMFQDQSTKVFGGGAVRAQEDLKLVQEAANNIKLLGVKDIDAAIKETLKSDAALKEVGSDVIEANRKAGTPLPPELEKEIRERNIKKLKLPEAKALQESIDTALAQKSKELGSPLERRTTEAVTRQVLAEHLKDMPEDVRKELAEKLIAAEGEEIERREAERKQRMAWVVYNERRQKEVYEVMQSVVDRRVPPSPQD